MKKLSLILLVVLLGCNSLHPEKEESYKKLTVPAWGTKCEIIYKEKKNVDVLRFVNLIFTNLSSEISSYDSTSHLSFVNRNESRYVSPYMLELLNLSAEMYKLTDGAFDPTVQPLVKEWGFLKQEGKWIDTTKLPAILEFVGLKKWKWNDSLIIEKPQKAAIDFNAIAPGYAADKLASYFEAYGIYNYFINNGGEIRTNGYGPGSEKWKIGITSIDKADQADTLYRVSNCAMATSGNYINQFEHKGLKYGHTISAKTGMPIQTNILSASIFAETAAKADAFATACMAMQMEEAIALMKKNKLTGYLIYKDTEGNQKRRMVE